MSEGPLIVLDGTQLADLTPPRSDVALTGAQLLDHADSVVSDALYGLSLPQSLKSSALRRLGVCHDDSGEAAFRSSEFAPELASKTIRLYIAAIADELKDEPLVVALFNGTTIRLILEDEDDFAMIAENLFTDLDEEDKGKISKSKISDALIRMGVDMGVPPSSELPFLKGILMKHGAEGGEELGQAQFASLLQGVLQDLADALAIQNVVLVQDIKMADGSKLRKILADEKQVSSITQKILEDKKYGQDDSGIIQSIRSYVEKNAPEFGLPRLPEANGPKMSEADGPVFLLYNSVFAHVEENAMTSELQMEELSNLVKMILEKFAELLEANPVYYDVDG